MGLIMDALLAGREIEPQEEKEEYVRGESQVIDTDNVHTVKLTKSLLNRVMVWSTSRYNIFKKSDAVALAYSMLKNRDGFQVFESGSYTQCSDMTHTGTYVVDGENGYIAVTKIVWNKETHNDDYHLIEKWSVSNA